MFAKDLRHSYESMKIMNFPLNSVQFRLIHVDRKLGKYLPLCQPPLSPPPPPKKPADTTATQARTQTNTCNNKSTKLIQMHSFYDFVKRISFSFATISTRLLMMCRSHYQILKMIHRTLIYSRYNRKCSQMVFDCPKFTSIA